MEFLPPDPVSVLFNVTPLNDRPSGKNSPFQYDINGRIVLPPVTRDVHGNDLKNSPR